ncbi:MAG: DUF2231 domain-containing protein [Deltaproteobacteria bacterium]|nr:DUF2231 domain-containing protein [Deltaproteobacteria bacterium]
MAQENYSNAVPSTASIAGHPIHPILIPFPIAFFVGALASDLAYWYTTDLFWARASLWLVGSGVVMAAVAAIFGLTDFLTLGRVRATRDGWIHFLGNGTIVLLQAVSWYLRSGGAEAAVVPWGLGISVLATLMLLVTGWYGGELAYRHMIGVAGAVCEVGEGEKKKHHKEKHHRKEEEPYRKAA